MLTPIPKLIWNDSRTDFLVSVIGLSITSLMSFTVFIFYYLNHYTLIVQQISFTLFLIGIMAEITILKYKNTYTYFNYLTIIISAILIVATTIATGGIFNHSMIFWIILLPALSGMILGRKGVIFGCTIAILSIATAYSAHFFNIHYELIDRGQIGNLSIILRASFFTILLSFIFAYITQRAIENMRQRVFNKNIKIKNLSRMIGHDILSSLSIILTNLELLQLDKSSLSPEIAKEFTSLQYKAQDIQDIVTSIRKIQSIESGKKGIHIERNDVCYYLTEVINELSIRHSKKNIHFKIDKSLNNLPPISIDKKSLKETILKAIISNAIKFSYPNKSVIITAEHNTNYIFLKIKDSGIGIPDDIGQDLFSMHSTISRKGTSGEIGSGLGLFIAKKQINFYDGDILFNGRPSGKYHINTGTEFILKFKTTSNTYQS